MTTALTECASHPTVVAEGAAAIALAHQAWSSSAGARAAGPSIKPEWLQVLHEGLGHTPYCIKAEASNGCVSLLPLCFVKSQLFGKFLVGLPYLNVGGVIGGHDDAATRLIDRAVQIADELDVRYLELRHEEPFHHPALNAESTNKVLMRLALPSTSDELWRKFNPKVRNQIRKAQQNDLTVCWGGAELLDDFYSVFATNMRDLGTPVYGRRLFAAILQCLTGNAELCIIRQGRVPLAGGLLIHGSGASEVPSASSLRRFNALNPNMLLYWSMLQRSMERGQSVFDFGRSSQDSGTYRFKAQWGAQPHPTCWQYYVRQGSVSDMRPDNPKLQRRIAAWRKLPVWLTRLIGPRIVRGIP